MTYKSEKAYFYSPFTLCTNQWNSQHSVFWVQVMRKTTAFYQNKQRLCSKRPQTLQNSEFVNAKLRAIKPGTCESIAQNSAKKKIVYVQAAVDFKTQHMSKYRAKLRKTSLSCISVNGIFSWYVLMSFSSTLLSTMEEEKKKIYVYNERNKRGRKKK